MFLVLLITYNLLLVGQLCELAITLFFFKHGYAMKDIHTGKTIGVGYKV